jgi:NAD(P)H-hydrate epimerase
MLTREQARRFDRRAIDELGAPSLLLMENAGRGCVDVLEQAGIHGPVLVVCGGGNNGGDGLVIARHLLVRRRVVRCVLLAPRERLTPDARMNHDILGRLSQPITDLSATDDLSASLSQVASEGVAWVVDAVLGTGASGPPRPPYDEAIRWMNATSARRLAVDLPSGLDCDTGTPAEPTFRAEHTCTFIARKAGFANPEAAPYLGQVHVVDIGVPVTDEASGG